MISQDIFYTSLVTAFVVYSIMIVLEKWGVMNEVEKRSGFNCVFCYAFWISSMFSLGTLFVLAAMGKEYSFYVLIYPWIVAAMVSKLWTL